MNNLKRVLSLGLAGTMLAGMMMVGAGAVNGKDFTDQDEIKHSEAVNTLVTLNVIAGKDTGAYDPAGSLTRAEMAKLIVYTLNGGKEPVLSTKAVPTYSDIKGHWAEKYIEYCSNLGIIAGVGDGTFAPDATLTGAQAAKMLLVSMNYDAKVFGFTGIDWELSVNSEANKAKLYKDLGGMDPTQTITRDDAAQLMYNGILAGTMEKSWGQNMSTGEISQNYTQTGASLFSDKFDGVAYEGILTASGKYALSGSTHNKDYFDVQLKKVDNLELTATTSPTLNHTQSLKYVDQDLTSLLGQYVKVLYNAKDKEVYGVYGVAEKNNIVITTTTDNVSEVKSDSIKIDDVKYDTDGLTYTASDSWADKVTFIDNDGDDKIELAIVQPVSVYKVSYVGASTVTLTDKKGNYAESSLSNKLDDILYYDGMAKDDIVIGYEDLYSGKLMLEKAEVLTNQITGYKASNSTYQLDGAWYSNQSGKSIALNDTLNYVAIGGVVYYAKVTSGANDVTNMAIVINTGSDMNGSQAKLLFSDGTKKVVYLASGTAAATAGNLYTYEINNSNEYKLATLTATMGDYTKTGTDVVSLDGTSNGGTYGTTQIADDAVIFLYKGQVGTAQSYNDGKVITGKELKTIVTNAGSTQASEAGTDASLPAATTDIFKTGMGGFTKATNGLTKVAVAAVATYKYPASASAVVNWPTTASSANYGFIVAAPYQTTIDGTKYMMYKVWDGENTVDYKFKTDSTTPAGVKFQVIGYDIVDNSTIKNVTSISTTSNAVTGLSGSEVSFKYAMTNLGAGVIGKLDGNTKYLYVNTDADKAEEIGVTGGSVQTAIQPNSGIYVKNVLATVNTDKTIQLIVVDVNNTMALQSSEKSALTITGLPTGYTVTVDGVEYSATTANVVKPGDVVKVSRAATGSATVGGLTISDTTTTNAAALPAAGQSTTFIADGTALTVAFGAPVATANIAIKWQASGAAGGSQSAAAPGAAAVGPITNGVNSVVLTLTDNAAQVITVTGTDAGKVTFTDSGADTALTVNTSSVSAAGGTVVFDITVTEAGCTSITYNVTVTVANP